MPLFKSLYVLFSTVALALSTATTAEPIRLSSPVFESKDYEIFGQVVKQPGKLLSLETLISQADSHSGNNVYLQTEVGQVCQKKGCFFTAQFKEHTLRITFKDYSFFIPTDANGKTVKVYGQFSKKVLSEQRAKHYAQDAGKNPAKIQGEQAEYALVATSVVVPKN